MAAPNEKLTDLYRRGKEMVASDEPTHVPDNARKAAEMAARDAALFSAWSAWCRTRPQRPSSAETAAFDAGWDAALQASATRPAADPDGQSEAVPTPSGHAADCAYHLDQYSWECTCGATSPARARGEG